MEEGRERTRERERDGNALKKNGEKSDARISSNPCANVAQWNSLEGPPLAKGCRSCRYCGRRIKGLLWKRREKKKKEKRREVNERESRRAAHRCPRIGIFRIIFLLFPFLHSPRSTLPSLLFAIHPSLVDRSTTLHYAI